MCLYGNDLNDSIGPIEAGLTWTIGKSRRDACDFVGGDVIKKQLADGVEVGEVTSGGFSPVLGENIAMGYVKKSLAKAGTELQVETRGRKSTAVTAKMPFVTCHYHRPSA